MGTQAGVMWNLIFTPVDMALLPVSRGWDFAKRTHSDFGYVIFDWDNFYASLIAGQGSKEIAYSNYIQTIGTVGCQGMVPNFASGIQKSQDRTEPPNGAKVLLELYNKYKDKWMVERHFDKLVKWNDWFFEHRLNRGKMISLGSDPVS